jgi:hypothetical protein
LVDTTSLAARGYNDGVVSPDTRKDSSSHPSNDGLTNEWTINFADQVTSSGDIAFHLYNTSTDGATLKGKSSSAAGWELQVGRSLGKIARKIDVSLVAGISFSSVNAKSSGTVQAQLTTVTDVFSLNGQGVPDTTTLPYSGFNSSTVNVVDANGNSVLNADGTLATKTQETSLLLGRFPTRTTTTSTADVKGDWHLKGAYYMFRVGPLFQIPITERLKLSLGIGGALAYVGTDYTADEEIDLTEVTSTVQTAEISHRNSLLPAFYADANAEYWLTERTGVYLGATYQRSRSFDQTLGGRTATVDLGTTSGVSTGITLRF